MKQADMQKLMVGFLYQREEILKAFLAKHGMNPDEAVQIVRYGAGSVQWWVEKRVADEVVVREPLMIAVLHQFIEWLNDNLQLAFCKQDADETWKPLTYSTEDGVAICRVAKGMELSPFQGFDLEETVMQFVNQRNS